MRAKVMLFIVALVFSQYAADSDKYVIPKTEKIEVYETPDSNVPMWGVGTTDRLKVIESKGAFYKIEVEGKKGWIRKSDCVATSKSKSFVFDDAEIMGYLDNPTPVYIIDADDANSDPINLERSFKDELRVNVDKETIERQSLK